MKRRFDQGPIAIGQRCLEIVSGRNWLMRWRKRQMRHTKQNYQDMIRHQDPTTAQLKQFDNGLDLKMAQFAGDLATNSRLLRRESTDCCDGFCLSFKFP
jgi:hypothetical protein